MNCLKLVGLWDHTKPWTLTPNPSPKPHPSTAENNQTFKQHVARTRTLFGGLHVDDWSVAQRIVADAKRAPCFPVTRHLPRRQIV